MIGGWKSAEMNCYPVVGGGRSTPKRFEFLSLVQTALVGLGLLIT